MHYGKLADSFLSAINHEKEIRMDRGRTFFSVTRENIVSDSIVLQGKKESVVFEKPDSVKQMTIHEKQNQIEHSYLFMAEKHTNVHVLDSLWRMELLKNRISVQTAVLHRDNFTGETRLSRDDSLFYISGGQTPEIKLGIRGETTLQGFVRISFFSLMAKNVEKFAVILVAWLVAAGLIAFLSFRKKTGEQILLNADHQTLIYQRKKIQLTKQSFQLFEFLWNQPDHFAKYDELVDFLYGARSLDKAENRLSQSVKRLRKSLDDIPKLKIENIPNNGYKIVPDFGLRSNSR